MRVTAPAPVLLQRMLSVFEEEQEDAPLCHLMLLRDITCGMRSSPASKQVHLPRNSYAALFQYRGE